MILEKYRRHFWYRIMRSASTSSIRRKALSRISFVEVSKSAYIGPTITITPLGGETPSKKLLKIGERATLSPNVSLLCSMHPEGANIPRYSEGERAPIIIESDVWIGADAVILGGVKIGKKSVVGAGAVVTDDVPPYSVVAGVPARVVKKVDED